MKILAACIALLVAFGAQASANQLPTTVASQQDAPIRIEQCATTVALTTSTTTAFTNTDRRVASTVRLRFDALAGDGRVLHTYTSDYGGKFSRGVLIKDRRRGLQHAASDVASVRCGVVAVRFENGESWYAPPSEFAPWNPFNDIGHQ